MRPLILRTSLMVRDDEVFSMNCRILACTAAGALALALMVVPAAAGVTTYTFTGQARVWLDNTSMFGDVNGDNDRSFTAVFTRLNDYDPDKVNTDGATYSNIVDQRFLKSRTR